MHNVAGWKTRSWAYLLLGITAAVLVASHTPVGAALSMDSLFYLSTASNVLDGKGIVQDTFALSGPAVRATTIWPPLYPMVLAGLMWLVKLASSSDVFGIAVFNFFALVASLFLMLRITARVTSITAAVVVAVALALSPSLQIVYAYAWSEVLFIPLCLAAYLGLQHYLDGSGSRYRFGLYAMIVLLGLATYTRYVGIAFFSAAALTLLLYGRGGPIERLRTVALASLAYLAILAPLFIRNLAVSGALSGGERGVPDTELLSDVGILGWYLHLELLNLPWLSSVALVLITGVSLVWLLRRPFIAESGAGSSPKSLNIAVPFLFAACYLAFLLVSRSIQYIDLDSRMLSVAVPFILIGLVGVYQQLSTRSGGRLAALPFLLPLCAFAINAIQTHTSILNGWRDYGEPGPVLGLTYRSLTGRQLDSLRSINEHFSPAAGNLVLTDIARPIIVKYLFPDTDVRQMPATANEKNLALLENPMQRLGLAIITGDDWSRALSKRLDGRADFFTIQGRSGKAEFVVIKLPVTAP